MELVKAIDAKKTADGENKKLCELSGIMVLIKGAAHHGKYSITLPEVNESIKYDLIRLGYTSCEQDNVWTIEWKRALETQSDNPLDAYPIHNENQNSSILKQSVAEHYLNRKM